MKKKYYYFYKITNLLNGKFYYGVHQTFKLKDKYMGSGTILNQAIKKYGKENFKKEILKYFENEKDMYIYEKNFITEKFLEENKGKTYNIIEGGCGGFKEASKGFKNKLEENPKFMKEVNNKYWKNLSDEDKVIKKKLISNQRKDWWNSLYNDKEKLYIYKEKHSKISKKRSDDNHPVWQKFQLASKEKWKEEGYKEKVSKLRSNREGVYYSKFKIKFDSIKDECIFLIKNTNLFDSNIISYFRKKGINLDRDKIFNFYNDINYINIIEKQYLKDFYSVHSPKARKSVVEDFEIKVKIKFLNFDKISLFNKLSKYINDSKYSDSSIYKETGSKAVHSISEYLKYLEIVTDSKIKKVNCAMKTILNYNYTNRDIIYIDKAFNMYEVNLIRKDEFKFKIIVKKTYQKLHDIIQNYLTD